jgi:hypothetical protein
MRRKRLTTAGILVIVAMIALVLGGFRFVKDQSKDVEEGAWVGWSRDALTARFGRPDKIHGGDYEPALRMRQSPPGSACLYYRTRRGHLYLWVKPGADGGVCYDSLWFRDGVRLCS